MLILTATCARADEMVFDPIDVLTGNASFQQSNHHAPQHMGNATQRRKESSFFSDHKNGKKYRGGKHITFELFFSLPECPAIFLPYSDFVFRPVISKDYRYLFFREINPPPPKSC